MSRIIQAVSIGCKVPDRFHAKVHSVFNTAANLSVAELDHLLTVILSDMIDLPQGIRLAPGDGDVILRLEQGQELICQEGVIRSAGYRYEIDLRQSHRYDGRVICAHEVPVHKVAHSYKTAWEILARQQSEKQADLNISDLWTALKGMPEVDGVKSAAAHHLSRLVMSALHLDHALAADAVRSLVGLGGGLTPTGDDVLVGFLAGLWTASGEEAARVEWLGKLRDELRVASRGTNDISRTYLILAAEGQFSSSLKNLTPAICDGEPAEKVREAADTAFQVGHTSGLDAATGLLAGLTIRQEEIIPNFPSNQSKKENK